MEIRTKENRKSSKNQQTKIEKINKIDKPQARLIKENKDRTQNQIKKKISLLTIEIKRIIKEY